MGLKSSNVSGEGEPWWRHTAGEWQPSCYGGAGVKGFEVFGWQDDTHRDGDRFEATRTMSIASM